jgi:hypothetical protein
MKFYFHLIILQLHELIDMYDAFSSAIVSPIIIPLTTGVNAT